MVGIFLLATYYSSIMALIGRYLYDSFISPLPWTKCQPDWINCVEPNGNTIRGDVTDRILLVGSAYEGNSTQMVSSSEYYFL